MVVEVVVVVVVHIRPGILIVWISTADINSVASHHVDTGLKVFNHFESQEIFYYYDQWNSQHLQLRGVVEDLVDHHPLQVTVHSGHALHRTRASNQVSGKVRSAR